MKLWILSDLHLEFADISLPKVDADVVILAGDTHIKDKGLEWAINAFPDIPVLYVLGNHEYYGSAYPKHLNHLKEQAKGSNVSILENDTVTIDKVTFLGCTLWTDFQLYGDPRIAGYEATQKMLDYKKIKLSPNYTKLRSLDTANIHYKSVRWLRSQFDENTDDKKVIITHHAPSEKSVPRQYIDDILSAAYASHLEPLVESSNVALWVHGHMHTASDYHIGNTRVLCNPRGYPGERDTNFVPDLIVEL
jgi:Icc-related predicted phosphoesterase